MNRLRGYDPVILRDEPDAIVKTTDGSYFTDDVKTGIFECTGDYFIKLLRGDLKPSECDARFPARQRCKKRGFFALVIAQVKL